MTEPGSGTHAPWAPDVLGDDWVARTLPLQPNTEGEVVATLVARAAVVADDAPRAPRTGRTAVLYIHGFADYFFQTHLAREWEERGIDFFAIDLHGYGRSLLEHQTPNFCTDLREYGEELAAATAVIRDELGYGRLLINGHSTGGLVAALWAHSATGRETVDGLVLNSPWLDLNRPWFDRVIGTAVLDVVGRRARYVVVQHGPSEYSRSLRAASGGEWDIDERYKPVDGTAVLTGWLRAIRAGQARLAAGLDVRCPVLVCCSTESGVNRADNPDLSRVDVVLDVRHIVARAPAIGPDVSVVQIEDGIHDLALSPEPARTAYFTAVFEWVTIHLDVPAPA
ncbi:alpha/beta hydrolase [Sanguibacter sp. 25GB23B1]|uniref:alpha/beta hydrolase n=1 Tax=unclassified Sanguibacter TaxID=2645534 RepID=UPI0032AF4594